MRRRGSSRRQLGPAGRLPLGPGGRTRTTVEPADSPWPVDHCHRRTGRRSRRPSRQAGGADGRRRSRRSSKSSRSSSSRRRRRCQPGRRCGCRPRRETSISTTSPTFGIGQETEWAGAGSGGAKISCGVVRACPLQDMSWPGRCRNEMKDRSGSAPRWQQAAGHSGLLSRSVACSAVLGVTGR